MRPRPDRDVVSCGARIGHRNHATRPLQSLQITIASQVFCARCYHGTFPSMALRFYNTLTQQVQPFVPADPNAVKMYTCGPTVYDFAHIGNFRTFVFYDLLRRVLHLNGYKLDHVMNITDVDDKIIRNAVAQGKSLSEYTEIYTKAFLDDCAILRLERPERIARATEHIPEMAAAIHKLEDTGHT